MSSKRIISLCCSVSGCDRNWSVFANVSEVLLLLSLINSRCSAVLIFLFLFLLDPHQKEEQVGAQKIE
jgi:hypothetical protein